MNDAQTLARFTTVAWEIWERGIRQREPKALEALSRLVTDIGNAVVPDPTPRQLEVLQAMADGHTAEEIGRLLYIERETVKAHTRKLRFQLNARNAPHLVAIGFRRGLIE